MADPDAEEEPRCPTCEGPLDPEHPEFLPFCSYRCKAVDLANWLDGTYQPPSWEEEEEEQG